MEEVVRESAYGRVCKETLWGMLEESNGEYPGKELENVYEMGSAVSDQGDIYWGLM